MERTTRASSRQPLASKRGVAEAQLEHDLGTSSTRRVEKAQAFEARMSKSLIERRLIAAEERQRELERIVNEKDILIERLESDRRWLTERESEERKAREEIEASSLSERESHLASNRELRAKARDAEKAHDDLQDSYTSLKRTYASEKASLISSITLLERKAAALESDVKRLQAINRERLRSMEDLSSQVEDIEAARDDSRGPGVDWSAVRDELDKQAGQLRLAEVQNGKLTAELAKHRAKAQNVEVLQEEKRNLELKLGRMVDLQDQFARLQGELDAARKEREEWSAFLKDPSFEPTSSTPVALTVTIGSLRTTNASLSEKLGSLQSLLDRRDTQLVETEAKLAEATATSESLSRSIDKANERIFRRQAKIKLLEMEVNSLKALLTTYEREEKMFGEKEDQDVGEDGASIAQRKHAEELEALLVEYKTSNTALQTALDELERERSETVASPPIVVPDANIDALRQALEESSTKAAILATEYQASLTKITSLEQDLESVNQQLWEAGVGVALGQRTPPNTLILQIEGNPAAEHFALRRQELDRLKTENQALLARLRDVEQNGINDTQGPLVPRESWDNLNHERQELLNTVAQKELRLLRLQQVYKAMAGEFREAVSSVLGYKLAFQNKTVRLTSVFDMSASMVFDSLPKSQAQQADVGTMKLISSSVSDGGQAGPPRMGELMKIWVHERKSIPCFLAALTLECWGNNQSR